MKGGVVRKSVNIREPNGNYFHDDRHACHYFLNNCTMQILSNSTISAITFRCTLKPEFESPFVHVRSGLFNHPVRQLFLKCLPTWHSTDVNKRVEMKRVNNGRSGGPSNGWGQIGQIEINNITTVQDEAKMQHQIYCSTFNTQSHTCDPVCPSIISLKYIPKNRAVVDQPNQHTVEKMLDYIRERLVPREGKWRGGVNSTKDGDMAEIRDTFFMNEPNIGISIIIMELMDGYLPIPENDARKLNISNALAKFEFKRLARVGFIQEDLNPGNYMINPTYNYIPNFPGRVILIDFGRAKELTKHYNQNAESAQNAEFARLDRTFRTEPAAGTITGHTYDEIVALLQQKNIRIREFLTANNIDLGRYVLSLNSRTIAGGATDISNENENDNEIIKQFLNNQPIDIIKQILEMHKQRILKVGDLIDKFNESNIKKQLTPSNINKNVFTKLLLTDSNDENNLKKKENNKKSNENKTTKKQQSPLRNTIFNNFNHNSTRLMVAGKKAKPFSRTRKNKRT